MWLLKEQQGEEKSGFVPPPCIIYLDTMATKVYEVHHERELKMGFVLVCARGSLYSAVCLPTA